MSRPPNVIFIITDQQSAGAIGALGWPGIRTPNLDRLVAEGVTCRRAYCTNPVCVPSRFSLLTGLMPSEGSTRCNRPDIERQPREIMQAGLGHRLREAGYRAVYAGKQHLPAMDAADAGFEVLTEDEREECAAVAADFLGGGAKEPFGLVVSFINPHDICYVPSYRIEPDTMTGKKSSLGKACIERVSAPWLGLDDAALDRFVEQQAPPLPANHERNGSEPPLLGRIDARHRLVEIPHCQWSEREWRLSRWIYDRLIEDVDRQIGVVLDAIDRHCPDALVIFTSDHGEMNGAHQLTQKNVFYEEAIRVPLVARWRDRIPAGSQCDLLVSNGLDCYPTILSAAGTDRPHNGGGLSLLDAWCGSPPAQWRQDLRIELDGGNCRHDGRRKEERYDDGTVIVRDIQVDPLELSYERKQEQEPGWLQKR